MKNDIAVLRKAIETYGSEAQLNVAIEEFSELIKEICKHKRNMDNTKAIIEEMADCYIMLTDFDHLYGKDVEIVGNIHDNPELLEGGEE